MSRIWWISTRTIRRHLNFYRSIRTEKFLQSSIRTAREESRCRCSSPAPILQYLAEKTGKLLPADAARRWETIQWVYFQMAFVGPMFGQVGFFNKFAGWCEPKDFT